MSNFNFGSINAPGATIAMGDGAVAVSGQASIGNVQTGAFIELKPEQILETRQLIDELRRQLSTSSHERDIVVSKALGDLRGELDTGSVRIERSKRDNVVELLTGLGKAVGSVFGLSSRLVTLLIG